MYKIININNYHTVQGGSETYFHNLTELLRENNHKVYEFTPKEQNHIYFDDKIRLPRSVDVHNIKLSELPLYFYNNYAKKSLEEILKTKKIDIAHLHIYYGRLTTSIFSSLKKYNIPIIQSLHEYKLLCPIYTMVSNNHVCNRCMGQNFYHAIGKKCKNESYLKSTIVAAESYFSKYMGNISNIDHFIAVSRFMKKQMEMIGISSNKITTVYNFVDTNTLKPLDRKEDYFLYFGRIEKIKGIKTLLSVFTKLKHIKLAIIGDGSYRSEVENYIQNSGQENIIYKRHMNFNELKNFVSKALAFIIPSEWYENCPMSVLESYGLGTMVIGSRIGGIPELIRDKEDGFLFEPGNVEQLKNLILWTINNKREAYQMGAKGRQRIVNKFNPAEHYKQIINVYRQLI